MFNWIFSDRQVNDFYGELAGREKCIIIKFSQKLFRPMQYSFARTGDAEKP